MEDKNINGGQENPEKSSLDDEQIARVVDDISRSDADKLLASDGGKPAGSNTGPGKSRNFFKRWWHSKPARRSTLTIILLLIIAAGVWPTSRYFVLDLAQVRSGFSATILDGSTGLPLAGVQVSLGGQTAITGENGQINLPKVKLGPQELAITKLAFAPVSREINVGFSHYNFGKISLKPVGVQYDFKLTDYLTGQPVAGAIVSYGSASAQSNLAGLVKLTLVGEQKSKLEIKLAASGYNSQLETIASTSFQKVESIQMVPAGRDYFVSSSGGVSGVYSANLNGSSRKLLLAKSGLTSGNSQLAADGDGGIVALVSASSTSPNQQIISLINISTSKSVDLDQAMNINIINWVDANTLIYVAARACTSGTCYQLESYNFGQGAKRELANASSFAAVLTVGDRIYYAAAGADPTQAEFTGVNADGTDKVNILNQSVTKILRVSYAKLLIATAAGQWYSYNSGNSSASPASPPATQTSEQFIDSPNGQESAWIDDSGGQPALMAYDKSSASSRKLASLPELNYPIRWIGNNILIFRANDAGSLADYAVNLNGGQPKKITNVIGVNGAAPLGG